MFESTDAELAIVVGIQAHWPDGEGPLYSQVSAFEQRLRRLMAQNEARLWMLASGDTCRGQYDFDEDSSDEDALANDLEDEPFMERLYIGHYISAFAGEAKPLARDEVEAMKRAVGAASSELWGDVIKQLPLGAIVDREVKTWLVAWGPLSLGEVGFGVPLATEDRSRAVFGFRCGVDGEQNMADEGVDGIEVARSKDAGVEVDLSDAAHARRVEALNGNADAGYFLIPSLG